MLEKTELELILKMHDLLKTKSEGVYSLSMFSINGTLSLEDDSCATKYHHYYSYGDSVTQSVIVNNVYNGNRKIIWTEKTADVDFDGECNTKGLPKILLAGQCFASLRDVNQVITLQPHWLVKQYLTVPEKHIGMVLHPDLTKVQVNQNVGHIVIVPEFEVSNA